ncbi:MAG TPA: hypothetical protein VIV58_26160 [Kofleriaceae bacterium]
MREIRLRVPVVRGARALLSNVAGLGLLVGAAWHTFGTGAGMAAAGVAVLALGWLAEPTAREVGR